MNSKFRRFDLASALLLSLLLFHLHFNSPSHHGIDQNSLVLVGAFIFCFLFAEFSSYFISLRKLKWGNLEAEFDFDKTITKFEADVIAAENDKSAMGSPSQSTYPPIYESYISEYENIIRSPSSNREKVLLGAILLERMIVESIKEIAPEKKLKMSPSNAIQFLFKEGFISDPEHVAFSEFWKVRNKVVHGEIEELSDKQTTRILDLLWRLVTILG